MNGLYFNICGLNDNRMFTDGGMEYWTGEGLCLFMFTVVDRVFGHISYRSDWGAGEGGFPSVVSQTVHRS